MRSVLVVEASLFTDKLAHSHRQMYGALLAFADAKGVCWPTIAALEDRLGIDGRHVRRVTAQMAALGIIAREKLRNGRWRYRLLKYFVAPRANGRSPTNGAHENKPRRDSESAKGVAKKDSELVANTESVAARAKEKISTSMSPMGRRAPLHAARSVTLKAKIKQQLLQKLVRFAVAVFGREEAGRLQLALMGDDAQEVQRIVNHYDHLMRHVHRWDDTRAWKAKQRDALAILRKREDNRCLAAEGRLDEIRP